ncbi:hypothetical protein [Streptomyces sp. TRM49041]|uniref:hypothetical protein n=1 Tax=Streptomyces sp. TRM49041 TaxID=2603216 RepID=UPI0016568E3D|nr:hypothetical protein [Streptomyces sp. TRM49041]
MAIDVSTAEAFGVGGTLAYRLVRDGEFPVAVIRAGNKLRVRTADAWEVLGVGPG